MMMTKRRRTLGIQIVAALAILGFVAYLFFPEAPANTFKYADNWYDESGLEINNAAAQAALKQQQAALHPNHVVAAPPAPLAPAAVPQQIMTKPDPNKVKAAFVILARNSDLNGVRHSIRQMEDRFNRKFNYPYVFLNEEHFTEEFKEKTSTLTNAQTHYGKIDSDMWGYPDFINQTRAAECRKDMEDRGVIYGGSESYRHMCRFQSGFFFRHPILDAYEYYWRVEPDIQYFCDVDYDVFQMMKDNQFKYGWTLSLTEYREVIPTLWKATQSFMEANPELINRGPDSLLPWLTDNNYESYNGCHFWSNFEIGSLDFFRSERYLKFFNHLDKLGGFFYERWGDAPVHSIAVAMMLKTSEVHFFNDIGYQHNPLMHCPIDSWINKKCHCNEKENFDWTDWSCIKRYVKIQSDFSWSESKYINMTAPYRLQA